MGVGGNDPDQILRPPSPPEEYIPLGQCCTPVCEIFCFAKNTRMTILNNSNCFTKLANEIKRGDLVLTFDGRKKIFSKVIYNKENNGIFKFYVIKAGDKNVNLKIISVTGNHLMIIFDKEQKNAKFKYASELKIGDLLRTSDGLFEINEISQKMMNNSYQIVVEKGTLLANDILVSTIYLKDLDNNNNKQFIKLLESSKIPFEIKN